MKPHAFSPLLLAFLGGAASAAPAVQTVASLSSAKETPATARIAPGSGLSPAIAQVVAGQLSPLVAGTEIFTVLPTGSMRPAFDDNTVLLTEPAPFQHLQIGDIVVFRHRASGLRIAHRILERRQGGYWTKGDHSSRMDDELVTETNYVGRVYGILYTTRSKTPASGGPLRSAGVSVAATTP